MVWQQFSVVSWIRLYLLRKRGQGREEGKKGGKRGEGGEGFFGVAGDVAYVCRKLGGTGLYAVRTHSG